MIATENLTLTPALSHPMGEGEDQGGGAPPPHQNPVSSIPQPNFLTNKETKRFRQCEGIILRNKNAFLDVGAALLTIHTERLYRANFATFEEYCAKVLDMTDRRARQLMDAFKVHFELSAQANQSGTIVPLPKTESQARELAKVPAEKRMSVLVEVGKKQDQGPGGTGPYQPTAKEIKAAAEKVLGTSEQRSVVSGQRSEENPQFKFGAWLEKLTDKVLSMVKDDVDLEAMEEELLAAVELVRRRRLEQKYAKAA